MASEIHQFDAGTVFESTIRDQDNDIFPINDAEVLQFIFKKPSGTIVQKTGALTTDGLDGKIQYTTNDTDLDEAGTWLYQVYIEKGPIEKYTNISRFRVYSNIQDIGTPGA